MERPARTDDFSHIRLSYITHFYCDQNNIDSVVSLLREYETFAPDLLDCVEFVIVDDGSPVSYEIPRFNLNLRWIKINENIAWNQAGARNLGALYAHSDSIVFADLDYALCEDTMRYMASARPCGRFFYKIYLSDSEGNRRPGHVNMFFLSRARFMRFFGYDENFSGHYGREDNHFVFIMRRHGCAMRYLPAKYRAMERNVNREKSYHNLTRDRQSPNYALLERKKQELCDYGAEHGYSRSFLNFSWTFLSTQSRTTKPAPKPCKWWHYLWYWRFLVGYA